jgi:TatD DNase family protein
MKLHDTHAHLDYLLIKNPDYQIEDYINTIDFWIQPGINPIRDRFCLETFHNNPILNSKMYFMIGAHPCEANKVNFNLAKFCLEQDKLFNDYQNLIPSKIIAIGEIGLDYTKDTTIEQKTLQKELFITQLQLALHLKLPIVIHCRDAFNDLFTILDEYYLVNTKSTFLIHCFTGTLTEYQAIVNRNGYIALGGILTYKNSGELKEVAKIATNLVVETDLPFLAPEPHRGKINQPEYIKFVFEQIAIQKETDLNTVISLSKANTNKIFNLPL